MHENTIYELVEQATEIILGQSLSKKVKRRYQTQGFDQILSYYESINQRYFCEIISQKCVEAKRAEYESEKITKASFAYFRRATAMLVELSCTGKYSHFRLPNWNSLKRPLCPNFESTLSSYRNSLKGVLRDSSISTYMVYIVQFLRYLEEIGYTGFKNLKLADISAFFPYISNRNPGGLYPVVAALRSFGKYLNNEQITKIDMTLALLKSRSPRKRVIAGFTGEEITALLNSPNRSTAIGVRDYAIFVLSHETGLRTIDIVNLRLSDIDWTKQEMRIVQHKTHIPLTLPFSVKAGNALADYILNARPDCESETQFIFLRAIPPYTGLHPRALSYITVAHMKKVGIYYSAEEGRGHHSFRRSIATNMLKESVPLNIIADVLGHRNRESVKIYLTADQKNLKECALGFQMAQLEAMV